MKKSCSPGKLSKCSNEPTLYPCSTAGIQVDEDSRVTQDKSWSCKISNDSQVNGCKTAINRAYPDPAIELTLLGQQQQQQQQQPITCQNSAHLHCNPRWQWLGLRSLSLDCYGKQCSAVLWKREKTSAKRSTIKKLQVQ